jgi:hypothetical protein
LRIGGVRRLGAGRSRADQQDRDTAIVHLTNASADLSSKFSRFGAPP